MKKVDAVVHAVKDPKFFCITTMSVGMLYFGEPDAEPIYLAPDATDSALGKSLREGLSKSRIVSVEEFHELLNSRIIHRKGKERDAWRMKTYGYRNKRDLYRDERLCSVSVSEGEIEIEPTDRNSFNGIGAVTNDGSEMIYLPVSVSDAELGAALREGFNRCTCSYKG